jgi:cytidylate kinase
VRRELVRWQRAIGDGGGIIMAGRDIGSVVLPDADVKLYIDASPEERARRRYAQQVQTSPETEYEQVLADTRRRDALDTQRADSPLVVAAGAIVIATDELDREQAVATVVEKIRAVAAAAGTCG